MKITIYGSSTNCMILDDSIKNATRELGIYAKIKKVKNLDEIAETGIITTPALAINDVIKFKGRVPSKEEIKKLLSIVKEN